MAGGLANEDVTLESSCRPPHSQQQATMQAVVIRHRVQTHLVPRTKTKQDAGGLTSQ